ncbi:MAG: hypothetical protein ACAI34_08820 [Verrucomicrobium sp.]
MAPIKSALSQAGWVVKASGVLAATGSFGSSTSGGELRTRYVMAASMHHYDYRFPDFAKMYHYDISVLDAKSNEEVLTMSGSGAATVIAQKLVKGLNSP